MTVPKIEKSNNRVTESDQGVWQKFRFRKHLGGLSNMCDIRAHTHDYVIKMGRIMAYSVPRCQLALKWGVLASHLDFYTPSLMILESTWMKNCFSRFTSG